MNAASFAAGIVLLLGPPVPTAGAQDAVYEKSITELAAEISGGRLTSVQLVDAYLARIAAYDKQGPALNAIITLNPRAREEARMMDTERRMGRARGPLLHLPHPPVIDTLFA